MTHTCSCGATFETKGGWNNYNKVLFCPLCTIARNQLLTEIDQAKDGKYGLQVVAATSVRYLLEGSDIDAEYRRPERMDGRLFLLESK